MLIPADRSQGGSAKGGQTFLRLAEAPPGSGDPGVQMRERAVERREEV